MRGRPSLRRAGRVLWRADPELPVPEGDEAQSLPWQPAVEQSTGYQRRVCVLSGGGSPAGNGTPSGTGPVRQGPLWSRAPKRLVGRYFPGSSIYKCKYQRTATGGHLPRLSRDWAQAGAGVADFLAPVNAAGCGCARVPDYADQRYWSRGAAVGGAWDRRRTEPGYRLEELVG